MLVIESRTRVDGITGRQRIMSWAGFADAMGQDVHTEFARLGKLLHG